MMTPLVELLLPLLDVCIWLILFGVKNVSPKERESICYNFKIEKDEYGRTYIIPSVTMSLPVEGQNCGFSNGCVSVPFWSKKPGSRKRFS